LISCFFMSVAPFHITLPEGGHPMNPRLVIMLVSFR
jgi:hypothetical protein